MPCSITIRARSRQIVIPNPRNHRGHSKNIIISTVFLQIVIHFASEFAEHKKRTCYFWNAVVSIVPEACRIFIPTFFSTLSILCSLLNLYMNSSQNSTKRAIHILKTKRPYLPKELCRRTFCSTECRPAPMPGLL